MTVAYAVLAHRRPEQVARLASRLVDGGHGVLVHVDAKTDLAPFEAAVRARGLTDEVGWVTDRVRCYWGDYSLVEATRRTTALALQHHPSASHVVLLSGQDYPIKPGHLIGEAFRRAGDRSFLFATTADGPQGDPITGNEVWPWADWKTPRSNRRHYRVGSTWIALPNRFLRTWPALRPPAGMQVVQGSQWWALHREAAQGVVDRLTEDRAAVRIFRRMQIPDENVVQMVMASGEHWDSVTQDDLHYIAWQGEHPRVLDLDDASALDASPKLFARKVDPEVSADLLDHLDASHALGAARPAGDLDGDVEARGGSRTSS